ncbi:MAG: DNA-formamidopyrimidine glycosylase family protein [Candidatus Brocadiia bacterium]
MAEGPLVHHYAHQLAELLEGEPVEVEFGIKRLEGEGASFDGTAVVAVDPHGKQFRIRFSDGRLILVHLLMWGSWGIYTLGAEWEKPRDRARLVLRTHAREVVAFSAPVIQLMDAEELTDSKWGGLGPDPLRDDFSREEVHRRMGRHPDHDVGDVLLDQRVLAGVGNILRNEILFGARVHPTRKVCELAEEEREQILDWTERLMRQWLEEMGGKQGWTRVYRRSGKACPRCGATIEYFKNAGRRASACPKCQR